MLRGEPGNEPRTTGDAEANVMTLRCVIIAWILRQGMIIILHKFVLNESQAREIQHNYCSAQ